MPLQMKILDMQGITEAVSKYFYSNGDSFDGLFVAPEHQDRFERLASDAIEYYENWGACFECNSGRKNYVLSHEGCVR